MLDYCCIIIISLLLSLNILPLVAEQNSALLVVGKFSDDTIKLHRSTSAGSLHSKSDYPFHQ